MRRVSAISRRTGTFLLRLGAIAAGLFIEYREIFQVKEAQWILVFLGLWFISVPPALWLDSLGRLSSTIAALSNEAKPGEGAREVHDHDRREGSEPERLPEHLPERRSGDHE